MTTTQTLCAPCGQPIAYIDCPTGGWWAHDEHPADEHDAFPPNGGHNADCAYVGGASRRCSCARACAACSGSGECQDCVNADSFACNTCLCTGECVQCDDTGAAPTTQES
jgi:hypothetical protein